MAVNNKNSMDVRTLLRIAPRLPPEIAVLLRGPTGIGKSHITHGIAKKLDLTLIDVRGSTMDEAKVTGIPDFETSKQKKVSTFVLPSWYVRACREPCLLFLDELNRSMPQVMQAFFQIVLDRVLGNDENGEPLSLHPETRVYAAVNFGAEYDVSEMDPALLRRFWTVDIEPEVKDWLDWADDAGLHPILVDFIRQNPNLWRFDPADGKITPGSVIPLPASWHRLDTSLKHAGVDLSEYANRKDQENLIYSLTRGFVGTEAAISFSTFVEKYENVITAEDVLNGKVKVEKAAGLRASDLSALTDKIVTHCKNNIWTEPQVKRVLELLKSVGGEHQMSLYNGILGTKKLQNIQHFHGPVGLEIVALIQAAREKQTHKK